MNDDELEIAILRKYIEQYESVDNNGHGKCARELDMRNVLTEIKRDNIQNLETEAKLWHNRLAPRNPGKSTGVLKPCSDSTVLNGSHKFNARAFTDPINGLPSPAWDRVRELQKSQTNEELLHLNPNFYGVGFNLKEGWKRIVKFFNKNT